MAGQVFVSYQSEDKVGAERICEGLERENVACWMAPRDIPAGRQWATAIVEAIQGCCAFVLVLSSNSKNAKQISREAELADRQGIPIITFRIEDVQPPPGLIYFLGNIQWLDGFAGQFDAAVAGLARLIRTTPDAGKQTQAMPPPLVPKFPVTSAATRASEIPAVIDEVAKGTSKSPAEGTDGSTQWLKVAVVAVLALVVIAAGLLWFRRPSGVGEARAVAKRFLSERDSGDFDAAWGECSPTYRQNETRAVWQKKVQLLLKQHGQPREEFKVCRRGGGGLICEYALKFPDGTAADQKLWLEKVSGGGWAIAHGTIQ